MLFSLFNRITIHLRDPINGSMTLFAPIGRHGLCRGSEAGALASSRTRRDSTSGDSWQPVFTEQIARALQDERCPAGLPAGQLLSRSTQHFPARENVLFLRATADNRCRCARNAKECRNGRAALQGRRVCKKNRTLCKLRFRRKFINRSDICCGSRQVCTICR